MKYFLCLQAGHEGVTSGATGAPGEQELNKRIRNRLSHILLSKKNADGSDAFMIQLVNANPIPSEINKDFHLFLAIHGDADIYGTGGGFVDFPHPSVDASVGESERIKKAIESEYFTHSGIANHPGRSNANTKFYYMWAQLTDKTPCNIIELGVVQDAHDKVILADTDRVCNALARGICKAFNVPYEQTAPPPPQVCLPKTEYDALLKEKSFLSGRVESLTSEMALLKSECQKKIDDYRSKVQKKLANLASEL